MASNNSAERLQASTLSHIRTKSTDASDGIDDPDHRHKISHLNAEGSVCMVDISNKVQTSRRAVARAVVCLGPELVLRIKSLPKGDVITTAKLAGIMAAKKTSSLIPLCHQIQLSQVHIEIRLDKDSGEAVVECEAKTKHGTGVEMEALTGATVACLTLYDMCKSVNKSIVIHSVKLVSKSGGKSDFVNT